MISPGTRLDTRFKLKVIRNGNARPEEIAFSDLLIRRTIVSVAMRNNTPTCDRQKDSLTEAAAEFDAAGYNVIVVSRDTCGSHARYAAAKGVPYILASDPKDQFARATDSVVEKSMYGRTFLGPSRSAYLIDRDGTVLAVVEKVEAAEHAAQIRAAIKTL